jgi:hypothetical protein
MDVAYCTNGRGEKTYTLLLGKLKGRDHLEDLVVVERIILERILREE